MYKLVNTDTHDVWLGTEQAVIKFANDMLYDKGKTWMYLHQDRLLDIGFIKRSDSEVEEITNIELATKYLQTVEDIEIEDLGDILEALKNNEIILLTQGD